MISLDRRFILTVAPSILSVRLFSFPVKSRTSYILTKRIYFIASLWYASTPSIITLIF